MNATEGAPTLFTGATAIGSENGRCFVLTLDGCSVRMALPLEAGGAVELSEEEAWCLGQQLLLACRRAARR